MSMKKSAASAAAPVKKTAAAPKAPAKAPAKAVVAKTAAAKTPMRREPAKVPAKATPAKVPAMKKPSHEAMLARVESVRLAQRGEGHFDCFGRAGEGYCDQGACAYHAECLSVSRLLHGL